MRVLIGTLNYVKAIIKTLPVILTMENGNSFKKMPKTARSGA